MPGLLLRSPLPQLPQDRRACDKPHRANRQHIGHGHGRFAIPKGRTKKDHRTEDSAEGSDPDHQKHMAERRPEGTETDRDNIQSSQCPSKRNGELCHDNAGDQQQCHGDKKITRSERTEVGNHFPMYHDASVRHIRTSCEGIMTECPSWILAKGLRPMCRQRGLCPLFLLHVTILIEDDECNAGKSRHAPYLGRKTKFTPSATVRTPYRSR